MFLLCRQVIVLLLQASQRLLSGVFVADGKCDLKVQRVNLFIEL
jgi:hypothetical protein